MNDNSTHFRALLAGACLFFSQASQAQWVTVGPTAGPGMTTVFDLQSFNGNLYAGGTSGNGSKCISEWNGTAWSQIARIHPQYNQYGLGINVLGVYNNQLVAGGSCDSIGGLITSGSDVVSYNGTAWSKLGINPPPISQVNCFAIYNSELYVGGQGVNKWDGTAWTSVSSGTATTGQVNSMAVYNNELYAGGNFKKIGGQSMASGIGFAKWNGTAWTVLPGLFDTLQALGPINIGSVAAMMPFNGELCVIGSMSNAGSTSHLHGAAKWNGTSWSDMHGGIKGNGSLNANCLAADGANLYIVGALQRVNTTTTNDSINQAARWDGSTWHPMLGTSSGYAFLSAEIFNNEVYSAYQSMVKWTGSSTTGIQPYSQEDLQVYPNPVADRLYIRGLDNETIEARVYNASGELVHAEKFAGGQEMVLSCAALTPGLYLVNITGAHLVKSTRFIRQ